MMDKRGLGPGHIGELLVVAGLVVVMVFIVFDGFFSGGNAQAASIFEELTKYTLDDLKQGQTDTIGWFLVPKGSYFYGFSQFAEKVESKDGDAFRPNGVAYCGRTNACICLCDDECDPQKEDIMCEQFEFMGDIWAVEKDGDLNNKGDKIQDGRYFVAFKGDNKRKAVDFSFDNSFNLEIEFAGEVN